MNLTTDDLALLERMIDSTVRRALLEHPHQCQFAFTAAEMTAEIKGIGPNPLGQK